MSLACLILSVLTALPSMDASFQKGITISCQGYGRVWGTPAFADELDRLKAMGVNSVAIHPYARIHADGRVSWRKWPDGAPPDYIVRPVEEARRRGMSIMIKPHLAYWGSPFRWRGEIAFQDPEAKRRFHQSYAAWMNALATACEKADILVIGVELGGVLDDEPRWRELIEALRRTTAARLTYAANWDGFQRVPFWDALDFVGVQGYFPLSDEPMPDDGALREGWRRHLNLLRDLCRRQNKPLLFTELGYNKSRQAAAQPWAYEQEHSEAAAALQERCLSVGLDALAENRDWVHGVYLWKWFVGPAPRANFHLDTPRLIQVIERAWKR